MGCSSVSISCLRFLTAIPSSTSRTSSFNTPSLSFKEIHLVVVRITFRSQPMILRRPSSLTDFGIPVGGSGRARLPRRDRRAAAQRSGWIPMGDQR